MLNDGVKKASFLLGTMLSIATKSVYIYTQKLNKDVTEDQYFLEHFLRVLIEDTIEVKIIMNEKTNNPEIQKALNTYACIGNTYNNNVIEMHDRECIEMLFGKPDVHFSIIDDNTYRLEYDTVKFMADGNFNDNVMSAGLKDTFLYLFNEECKKDSNDTES